MRSDTSPLASVVLPTFDRVALVVGAVESVLAQSESDFELLVVDDGSRDGTEAVLRESYAGEPRVRVLRQENAGISGARNRGIENARGRYLALVDSDDRWDPGFLRSQIQLLERHPEVALAYADGRAQVQRPGRPATMRTDPDFKAPDSLQAVLEGAWAYPSGWCFRTEALRAVPFDPALRRNEDTDLLVRLLLTGWKLAPNHDVLFAYRDGGGGPGAERATADDIAMLSARVTVLRRHLPRAPEARGARRHLQRTEAHLALALARAGRWREARPLLLSWGLRPPTRPSALWLWLRSLVARRPLAPRDHAPRNHASGMTASASTSINAPWS